MEDRDGVRGGEDGTKGEAVAEGEAEVRREGWGQV